MIENAEKFFERYQKVVFIIWDLPVDCKTLPKADKKQGTEIPYPVSYSLLRKLP